ncbi:MAG: hypothetical protein ABWY04_15185, partial [Arthrobacter sp.]
MTPAGEGLQMIDSRYTRFLAECITADRGNDLGLKEDEMFGVYVSWCLLNRVNPGAPAAFWASVAQGGHNQRRLDAGRYVRPGLGMTGPAA